MLIHHTRRTRDIGMKIVAQNNSSALHSWLRSGLRGAFLAMFVVSGVSSAQELQSDRRPFVMMDGLGSQRTVDVQLRYSYQSLPVQPAGAPAVVQIGWVDGQYPGTAELLHFVIDGQAFEREHPFFSALQTILGDLSGVRLVRDSLQVQAESTRLTLHFEGFSPAKQGALFLCVVTLMGDQTTLEECLVEDSASAE